MDDCIDHIAAVPALLHDALDAAVDGEEVLDLADILGLPRD